MSTAEALMQLRGWFETQRKVISKGGPSSWDKWQCEEQIAIIDAALGAHLEESQPAAYVVFDDTGDPIYCAAYEGACHEHINEAIHEHGFEGAAKWKVKPLYDHK